MSANQITAASSAVRTRTAPPLLRLRGRTASSQPAAPTISTSGNIHTYLHTTATCKPAGYHLTRRCTHALTWTRWPAVPTAAHQLQLHSRSDTAHSQQSSTDRRASTPEDTAMSTTASIPRPTDRRLTAVKTLRSLLSQTSLQTSVHPASYCWALNIMTSSMDPTTSKESCPYPASVRTAPAANTRMRDRRWHKYTSTRSRTMP